MPTNRTRMDRGRTDRLNPNQHSVLTTGTECFPGYDGFQDDDHRREAWLANREMILREWGHPGRRPHAFWLYDVGLEPIGLTFCWPEPFESEQEAALDLLKRGKLTGCLLDGTIGIESEPRAIRESWLNEVRLALLGKDRVPRITRPLPTWGTPTWFFAEYAPRILAARKPAEKLG